MLFPIKVVDIELTEPIPTLKGLEHYMGVQGLVRLHGVPIGYVKAPVSLGRCTAATLSKLILDQHSWAIICQLLKNGLIGLERPEDPALKALIDLPPVETVTDWPLVTVAVCTRDRPDDMRRCLGAIVKLDYPNLEVLVVDNAPATDATKNLVESHYPQVRYVCEPRPGLNWARNRAILEANGEIIAYTDDDVVVDRGWARGLARVFSSNPEVMLVTGLVVPYELETKAQVLFEKNGGFGRGFERRWYKVSTDRRMPWDFLLRPGLFGTGANMACRRLLFDQIGGFDPALDVGTVTNGGGDLEMFYRTLKEGYALVYEPSALVRHCHRRDYDSLKKQVTNNGSVYAYLICNFLRYPNERLRLFRLGIRWLWIWHVKNFLRAIFGVGKLPLDLVLAEARGCWAGLFSYPRAKTNAKMIAAELGPLEQGLSIRSSVSSGKSGLQAQKRVAVRTVELSRLVGPILDVSSYAKVRVYATWQGSPVSCFEIDNQFSGLSVARLCDSIVNDLGLKLLYLGRPHLSPEMQYFYATSDLCERLEEKKISVHSSDRQALPEAIKVSVVVATYDRPHDLPNCIRYLLAQKSNRPIEIVIVDNHPASGITPPIVAEFPNVVLVEEPRKGLAYARNAGILVSTGDIIVATDDDVSPPPDWIEKLIAPFARPEVMAVTGNTLPIELDTLAQQLFEEWGDGGLGRGFDEFEGSHEWFERTPIHPVPAWKVGATANAAFRAKIFGDPEIGLMFEPLGPGMPSGVGEDTYLFYKIMKAGYSVVYHPSAYVWHRHRREMTALKSQLYNYSKGIVSYQLTTLLRDKDQRALKMLFFDLPRWHVQRIKRRLKKRSSHPISLQLLEISGHIVGPFALWRSHRRVGLEGRSGCGSPKGNISKEPAQEDESRVLRD